MLEINLDEMGSITFSMPIKAINENDLVMNYKIPTEKELKDFSKVENGDEVVDLKLLFLKKLSIVYDKGMTIEEPDRMAKIVNYLEENQNLSTIQAYLHRGYLKEQEKKLQD